MSDKMPENIEMKRPLSPHITIYKPQISSVLSIAHRLTGVALYFGVVVLALWFVMSIYGCSSCIMPLVKSRIGSALLVLWTMVLYYHLCNGIRHLFWDAGKGFSLKAVDISGAAVIVVALLLTFITWLN